MSKDNVVYFSFFLFSQRFLNPKNFSLHIAPVLIGDSGDFACIVNDKPPVDIVELVVHDVPESPSRPMITSFTSRSVNLSWAQNQHPKNEPVTDFVLETR
jgi:receptor-type tyrosine-protein phosphatase gamma